MKRVRKVKVATLGNLLYCACLFLLQHDVLAQAVSTSSQLTTDGEEQLINTAALTAPLIVQPLLSGELTVDEAYDQKLLTVGDAWYLLSEHIDDWGGLNGQRNVEVRRGLAALLVQRSKSIAGVIKPQNANKSDSLSTARLAKLPIKLRLWLADYFQSIGNERTVPFAESVLSTLKAQQSSLDVKDIQATNRYEAMVFQAVERMAWLYRDKGEYSKAAVLWESVPKLYEAEGWWTSDAKFEAIRSYLWANESQNTERLTKLLNDLAEKNDEFTRSSLWILSGVLLRQDRTSEVRQFLTMPSIQKLKDSHTGFLVSSGMGLSYYREGRFDNAKAILGDVVLRYESQFKASPSPWVWESYNSAQNALIEIERWSISPLQSEPNQLDVIIEPENSQQTWKRTIRISSHKAVPIAVACSDKRVQVRITGEWNRRNDGLAAECTLEVQINAADLKEAFDAEIRVESKDLHGKALSIPVYVDVQQAVEGEEEIS